MKTKYDLSSVFASLGIPKHFKNVYIVDLFKKN